MTTLTLKALAEMASQLAADLPKIPVLASCSTFAPERAFRFEHDGREYVGAVPDFWGKVEKATGPANPITTTPIWDLDDPRNEARRREFFDAMYAVLSKHFAIEAAI